MKYFSLVVVFIVICCGALADTAPQSELAKPKTISIDMPNASIQGALREIADRFEINVVIPDTLNGKISIKMQDVTWQQAFSNILGPVGYTYVEAGDIIKIVSQKPTSPESEKEGLSWSDGPWYITTAIVLFGLATAVCHIALFVGVLRDDPVRPHFAPRIIWALLVLIGGVLALLAYWIIHHSNLRSHDKPA